jgi:hypothetical protein
MSSYEERGTSDIEAAKTDELSAPENLWDLRPE